MGHFWLMKTCWYANVNFLAHGSAIRKARQIQKNGSSLRPKEERGCYPNRICADSSYMTSENKKFCAANKIRFSSRPRKKQVEAAVQTAEQQEMFKSDSVR
jgi:hypothetical protein